MYSAKVAPVFNFFNFFQIEFFNEFVFAPNFEMFKVKEYRLEYKLVCFGKEKLLAVGIFYHLESETGFIDRWPLTNDRAVQWLESRQQTERESTHSLQPSRATQFHSP